jgi:hypothetical protein
MIIFSTSFLLSYVAVVVVVVVVVIVVVVVVIVITLFVPKILDVVERLTVVDGCSI